MVWIRHVLIFRSVVFVLSAHSCWRSNHHHTERRCHQRTDPHHWPGLKLTMLWLDTLRHCSVCFMRVFCVQVLVPDRKLSEGLLATLALRPEFSLFRSYLIVWTHQHAAWYILTLNWINIFFTLCIFLCFVQDYNLTDEIEQADEFTVFAPTDAAINDYLKKMAATTLVQEKSCAFTRNWTENPC